MHSGRGALSTLRLIKQASSVKRIALTKRYLHQRVPPAFDLSQGLPGFLSPEALQTIAVDWQQGLLDRLNDLVRGTEVEHASVLQTIKQTATDPTMALAFNHASEALNNSFFLSTLSPQPSKPRPDRAFWNHLRGESSHLRDLPSLVSHFSSHVAGLHPSSTGYVWLVADQLGNLGVVGTYAGGTVLVQSRAQMGPLTNDDRVLGEKIPQRPGESGSSDGSSPSEQQQSKAPSWAVVDQAEQAKDAAAGTSSSSTATAASTDLNANRRNASGLLGAMNVMNDVIGSRTREIGKYLHPILCISVHPHCYIRDYGVWGRDEYVKAWWKAIDWSVVELNWEKYKAKTQMQR